MKSEFAEICDTLAKTRPTAVDLFWALERMKDRFAELTKSNADMGKFARHLWRKLKKCTPRKELRTRRLGGSARSTCPENGQVMTQCNAGALATAGIGTALGVIRVAYRAGEKAARAGARDAALSAGGASDRWESMRGGIPLTLITDNMVGHFLKTGKVGAIVYRGGSRRRKWRYGEQDRNVSDRGAGQGEQRAVLYRGPGFDF